MSVGVTNSDIGADRPTGRGRPARSVIDARFASAVDELENYGGLPSPQESRLIWDDIWHQEAHNSTAIEGNTLVLREVRTLLDENRPVGGKDLKDYMEVLGYGEAAQWVYSQARKPDRESSSQLISVTEVRNVHELMMKRVWEIAPHPETSADEKPGSFRRHDIRPFSGGMVPPPWVDVSPQLTTWVDRANQIGAEIGGGQLASADISLALADLHSSFERINPFIDGDGRTGRLVPLKSLATGELSYQALRQAAARGRLEATYGADGSWRSSKLAVDAYVESKYARTQ